jgi:hypothetical protein
MWETISTGNNFHFILCLFKMVSTILSHFYGVIIEGVWIGIGFIEHLQIATTSNYRLSLFTHSSIHYSMY